MNGVNLLLYIFHFGSPTFLFALLFVFDCGPGYTGIMSSLMLLGEDWEAHSLVRSTQRTAKFHTLDKKLKLG